MLSSEDNDNETSAEDVRTDRNYEHSNNVQQGFIPVDSEHWSNVSTVTKEKKITVSKPSANITSVDPLAIFNFFTNKDIEHIVNYNNFYTVQSHVLKNKSRFKT